MMLHFRFDRAYLTLIVFFFLMKNRFTCFAQMDYLILPSPPNPSPSPQSESAGKLTSSAWYRLMYSQSESDETKTKFLGCRLQKRYIKAFNDSVGDGVNSMVPACSKPIKVRYTEMKPLLYTEVNGTDVRGILKDFLQKILVERCCVGYGQLQFVKQDKHDDMFFENFNNENDNGIVAPVEFRGKDSSFLGHHLAPVFQHRNVYFLAIKNKIDSYVLLKRVIYNALLTWPLFVTALSMAVMAGVIIWLTEQWSNEDNFQKTFPRGVFEGFWWAYVSMTTVGYGDKTPSTVFGRLFAIVWILIGITIFNMFTAAIIAGLNNAIKEQSDVKIIGADVGFVESKVHVYNTIVKEFAMPKVFKNTSDMISALENRLIYVMAMDELAYNHALPQIKESVATIQIERVSQLVDYHVGFGVLRKDNPYYKMQMEFNQYSQEDLPLSKNFFPQKAAASTTSLVAVIFNATNKLFWMTITITMAGSLLLVMVCQLFKRLLATNKK